MRYMGSKRLLAKEILPIILKDRKPEQWYVEPFVGGFNVIEHVEGNRIASDINYYLVECYKAVIDGWEPPSYISRKEYIDIKNYIYRYPPELVGFVGFGCSYGGKWFGGYAQGGFNKNGQSRNHCNESKKNIIEQAKKIKDIIILCRDYRFLEIPEGSLIYCDPPYKDTTKYNTNFDHDIFWEWVRNMSIKGHDVYISEYTAPKDMVSIWCRTVNSSLDKKDRTKKGIEHLFKYILK